MIRNSSLKGLSHKQLHYGDQIAFKDLGNHYIYAMGFINKQLFLQKQLSPQCYFSIQPKRGISKVHQQNQSKIPVIFGTEVLIKHCQSEYYLKVIDKNGTTAVCLDMKQSQECYFTFLPQRTFQHEGDFITVESIFIIENVLKHVYINCSQTINESKGSPRASIPYQDPNIELTGLSFKKRAKRTNSIFSPNFTLKKTENLQEIYQQEYNFLDEVSIFKNKQVLEKCQADSNQSNSSFTFQHRKEVRSKKYIKDNDYIYFMHSYDNSFLSVSIEKDRQYEVFYKKFTNENQVYSSLFHAELINQNQFCLKHVISGRYFPFSNKCHEQQRPKIFLDPLLTTDKKTPPFNIIFQNKQGGSVKKQVLKRSNIPNPQMHGYWLYKARKKDVAQILSIKNVDPSIWIPYLSQSIKNSKTSIQKKQLILRSFYVIDYLIQRVIPNKIMVRESYQLLFDICQHNYANKKRCMIYLADILQQPNKELILDLLTELLSDPEHIDDVLQKSVTPSFMIEIVRDFIKSDEYSIHFLRIFRTFCGPPSKPCLRNQMFLFKIFFSQNQNSMTESILANNSQKAILPKKFRFIIKHQGQKIYFCTDGRQLTYQEYNETQRQFIRQYFYFIADCLSGNNQQSIKQFCEKYPESILNKVLYEGHQRLRGPIISLLISAYLSPARKFKLYIHHKEYPSICFKGEMIQYGNEQSKKLTSFIQQQLQQIQVDDSQIGSTTLRLFLKAFKITIENGYWKDYQELKRISEKLDKLQGKSPKQLYYQSYQEKLKEKNLMGSKILAIQVDILLLDLKINLWISELITLREVEAYQKMAQQLKKRNFWRVNKRIFKLCSTENSQLMRVSLMLFHKIYNLPCSLQEYYLEANKQKSVKFVSQISKQEKSLEQIYSNFIFPLKTQEQYFKIIAVCIQGVKYEHLVKNNLEANLFTLRSVFQYHESNSEFQSISFKLQVHENIIQDIKRYVSLRNKDKIYQQDLMYWKVLLLYALIKDNSRLRDQISQYRKYIVRLLYEESLIYYVAADILEQIYRNNRKLIITDSKKELYKICDAVDKSITLDTQNVTLKDCKLLYLLGTFLQTGNRRVQASYQAIIKGLFKKEQIPLLQMKIAKKSQNPKDRKIDSNLKMKEIRLSLMHAKSTRESKMREEQSIDQDPKQREIVNIDYFNSLFKVIIYELLIAMKKPTLTANFQAPYFQELYNLLLRIGKKNWSLKGKIIRCIDFKKNITIDENSELLTIILSDLNALCEKFNNAKILNTVSYPKEILTYINNIPKLIVLLNSLFQSAIQNCQQQKQAELKHSQNSNTNIQIAFKKKSNAQSAIIQRKNQQLQNVRMLMIKIIQRMFLLKDHCPQSVGTQIQNLKSYLSQMDQFDGPQSDQDNQDNESEHSIRSSIKPQEIIKFLGTIKLQEFTPKQLRQQRQPLTVLFQQKNAKLLKRMTSKFQQAKAQMQEQAKKKLRKVGLSINKMEVSKEDTKLLQNFVKSLYKVNQYDSTILSDNIKEFLLNFLRQSFLFPDKEEDLPKRQQMLGKYQIPQMICSICQQEFQQRYNLFITTFHLATRILQGGNQFCQQQFLKIFIKDQNNTIFQNIALMVRQCLKTLNFYYNNAQNGHCVQVHDKSLQFEQIVMCQRERKKCCELLNKIFRFLQLLCEQNNFEMKNFMYSQVDNSSQIKNMSINFLQLAQTVFQSSFESLTKNIQYLVQNPDGQYELEVRQNLFPLPLSILDFLVQVCQIPAQENQIFLCRTDFFKVINDLSVLRQYSREKDKSIVVGTSSDKFFDYGQQKQHIFFIMQKKLVILLRSLLEQNSDYIKDLLLKQLNEKDLEFLINQSCEHGGLEDIQKLKQLLSYHLLNPYLQNVVDIIIISKMLYPMFNFFKVKNNGQSKEKNQEKSEILQQMANKIKSIEVCSINGNQLTIYYPYQPLFQCLTKNTKDFIIERSAKLNTRAQKLRDFLNCRYIVYQDMEQSRNQNTRAMSDQNMNKLFLISLILCYLILGLLTLFYSVSQTGAVLDIIESRIIGGLSLMQFLLTTIYFILYGINRSPVAKQKLRKQQISKLRLQQIAKRKHQNHQDQHKDHPLKQINISHFKMLKTIYYEQSNAYHALILFVVSFFALTLEVRLYCFSLLYLFANIQLLKSILKAISLTWKQLFIVCLLAIVFSFIFGVITLNNYLPSLYQNQAIQIDLMKMTSHCHSLLTCIDSLFTQRIIGQSANIEDKRNYYGKFISDLIYWGFFEILLINIIGAIIIDKFAQQRNYKQKIQHQRTSKCYICEADRASLQRGDYDFRTHVEEEHNIWDYYFYMYTLQKLTVSTQYTGIEYWIQKQMKQNQIDWLPEGRKKMFYNEKNRRKKYQLQMYERKQKNLPVSTKVFENEKKQSENNQWLSAYSSGHSLGHTLYQIPSQRDFPLSRGRRDSHQNATQQTRGFSFTESQVID